MYNSLKNLKLREILNLSLVILILLIVLNYMVGFNSKTYIDEILTVFYVACMFSLKSLLLERLVLPIERIYQSSETIIEGDAITNYIDEGKQELGKINENLYKIADNFQKIKSFAYSLEKNEDIEHFNYDDAIDNPIIQSLLEAQKQTLIIKKQEKKRNWVTNGLANFVEILGSDEKDFSVTADKFINKLVKYVKANQGGLFILNDDNNTLELIACYAYDKKKYTRKIVASDEGMIGQAFQESATIYLEKIPDNYITIKSGLGTADPNYLLLVPLKNEKKSQGVIELAMFQPLEEYQIEFIEKLAETLATTIVSGKINSQTKKLLQESQKQSTALRNQEEELVKNVEELQAVQELTLKKQHLAEKEKKELDEKLKEALLKYRDAHSEVSKLNQIQVWFNQLLTNSLEAKIILDTNQQIVLFNDFSSKHFWGQISNPIQRGEIGKILHHYIRQFVAIGVQKALLGEYNSNHFSFVGDNNIHNNRQDIYFEYHFIPLKEENQIIGVLVIVKDITEIENQKLEQQSLRESLVAKDKIIEEYENEMTRLKEIYKLK
ncbi:MAG: hypothetical protein EAZ44_03690 [Cytophagia bacterium]|nr:MAG: hypothetical protein EAZ44_03690 [Cytophagia bacterium]TAG43874.1 MAG: hypothetical protein EAZ31_03430 [Cytophagia bacterium]